jgi:2,3-bisphosphoglycerate-independent phosphoglycerate mutase
LRIAETEKYAHVTFFFSGGREAVRRRDAHPRAQPEGRDLRPAAGNELPRTHRQAGRRDRSQRQYDAIVCNIANPDMVGHTGVLSAAAFFPTSRPPCSR